MTLTLEDAKDAPETETITALAGDPDKSGVVAGKRILTRRMLASVVSEGLDECRFERCLVSALAARFTADLGRRLTDRSQDLVLYGSPKKQVTREQLREWAVDYERGEFLVDYSLGWKRGMVFDLLVGCESEVHPSHGVGYSFQRNEKGEPVDGYAWDFRKLIHCPAPNLLFVAWLAERKFARLQETLQHLARDYSKQWMDKSIGVVLIPTADAQRGRVSIGLGASGGEIFFASLEDSLEQSWLSSDEYLGLWDASLRMPEEERAKARMALFRRLAERNDYIRDAYGVLLRDRFPGKWAAIDPAGRFFLAESKNEVSQVGRLAFGRAGGATLKLELGWGANAARSPRRG